VTFIPAVLRVNYIAAGNGNCPLALADGQREVARLPSISYHFRLKTSFLSIFTLYRSTKVKHRRDLSINLPKSIAMIMTIINLLCSLSHDSGVRPSVSFSDSIPFARWRYVRVAISNTFDMGQRGRLNVTSGGGGIRLRRAISCYLDDYVYYQLHQLSVSLVDDHRHCYRVSSS